MDSKIEHHRRIASILSKMNHAVLDDAQCVFAGDTSIAMQLSNFRLSTDIDFLCASMDGYRQLRSLVGQFSKTGLSALFNEPVTQLREVRADRYGIRSVLDVEGAPIKFEIVSEGRIGLDPATERMHGVPVIARVDAFAEKLLANSDRWLDKAELSKDVLDLAAMVEAWGHIPIEAENKAVMAYGDDVLDDLQKAGSLLLENEQYRERCFKALDIDLDIRPALLENLEKLSQGLALEHASPANTWTPRGPSA